MTYLSSYFDFENKQLARRFQCDFYGTKLKANFSN